LEQLKGRTSFLFQSNNLTVNNSILDIECRGRIFNGRELASKIPFVSRKDSRFTAGAQGKSAITVELNFLDPGASRPGTDKLRFHRLNKVRQTESGGTRFHKFERKLTGAD
jgi:hypothetical protein